MARERLITRTITVIDYEVMVVNMDDLRKVEFYWISIPSGDCLTEKNRDEAIKAQLADNLKYVQVMDVKKTEKLYGMSEVDFLKYAKELPPR